MGECSSTEYVNALIPDRWVNELLASYRITKILKLVSFFNFKCVHGMGWGKVHV